MKRLQDVVGTENEVDGGNWVSRRLLLADAGMGYSVHDTVIKAGTEYESLAANKIGDRMLATPSIADGALFLRTDTHLFRVENAK